MITSQEIYWLAGLLEGEGSFGWASRKDGIGRSLSVRLDMTDQDVVERAARLMGIKKLQIYEFTLSSKKTSYRAVIYGPRAVGVMMTVFSLMGTRRKQKIHELLVEWRKRPHSRRYGISGRRIWNAQN